MTLKTPELNTLTQALARFCAEHPLAEKWVAAPTWQIGQQWLAAIARAGHPVINARVKTLRALALDLSAPELAGRGLSRISEIRSRMLAARLFGELPKHKSSYLAALDASPGLIEALHRSITDIRLAGIDAKSIDAKRFEVGTKGREIARFILAYEAALAKEKLVDSADLLRFATLRLRTDPTALPANLLLLMASDTEARLLGLARDLWAAFPADKKRILPVDQPGEAGEGTTDIFSAVGAVNEVRTVLRRCLREGIPFDDVEILHTDTATYVPLIYELGARIDPGRGTDTPFTFSEGIPARFSRPARALIGWAAWIQGGYPQASLVRMIQEGLLRVDPAEESGLGFIRLGKILREVPIGFGADRYLPAITEQIRAVDYKLARVSAGQNEQAVTQRARYRRTQTGLTALQTLLTALLSPGLVPKSDPAKIFGASSRFVAENARCPDRTDLFSRTRLINELEALTDAIDGESDFTGDPFAELLNLVDQAHVQPQGPQPGAIHVSSIGSGGHTGRGHIFIIGLDDRRFPGTGREDPLLLDAERGAISTDLSTAKGRIGEKLEDFALLLARLRGDVTLGFSARSLDDDRHLFAGAVVMNAFRMLSGNREGDQEALTSWLGAPSSFAPDDLSGALDPTEWWIGRICGPDTVSDPDRLVADHFPHLGHGQVALAARRSNRFTAYDGHVPEAGVLCNPFSKDAPALSASRLQALGKSPLDYFFAHILGIAEPEELGADPAVWLDPISRGSLLHDLFYTFMVTLTNRGLEPNFNRDRDLLEQILQTQVAAYKTEIPAPSDEVFRREVDELREIANVFLKEEDRYRPAAVPAYFETSIGLPPQGGGSPIDTRDPVEIALPGGKSIRAHGRIDRIDRLRGSDPPRLALWDYKTGSAWAYSQGDPNRQGRVVQNTLYSELIKAAVKKSSPGASIESFGYFFPGLKEYGSRIVWSARELEQGLAVISDLAEMLAAGCFPVTDDPSDLIYSDYKDAYGDIEEATKQSGDKLSNPDNEALGPFMRLRGYHTAGDDA